MNKKERKERVSLTLFISFTVFVILLISVCVAAGIIYLLATTGWFRGPEDGSWGITSVILFMTATSLVVGALLTFFIGKLPIRPFVHIVTQMNRLASGDFKARLAFKKPYDVFPAFRNVGDSFNKMAEELEGTELLRADFINNFSHEFKTPIVSIAGFAKLLKRGNLSEEQRAEYIDIIEEESLRLSYMATNVLNLTKIENQAILSEVTTFNLSEQIRSCVLLFENKWVSKRLELNLEFDEYTISANEELLKQVWINLIDNAIKFSPDCGVVSIEIPEEDESVQVCIRNMGTAIPEEKKEKIFKKFYQADESHATEGNGVGLAIVKRIVDLHDGMISVDNGEDTVSFFVTLPTR